MRTSISIVAFAFATSLIVGCANEPPKCSDAATLSLAKKIVCKDRIVAMLDDQCKTVSIQHARAASYDAAVKKLTCIGNLVIPVAGDAGVDAPMKYESQLDDQGRQVVSVYESSSDVENSLAAAVVRQMARRQVKEYEQRDREREKARTAANKAELPSNTASLASLAGQPPGETLRNPALKAKLLALLQNDFTELADNLVVASDTEIKDGYLFGSGCRPHVCTVSDGAYAVNIQTGATYAAITSGNSIKVYGAPANALPPPLRQWYREHGGKD